jgi:hypothetical protein
MKPVIQLKDYIKSFPELQWEGDEYYQRAITIFGVITIDNVSTDTILLFAPDDIELGEYDSIDIAQADADMWYRQELSEMFDTNLSTYNRHNPQNKIYYTT